MKIIVGKFKGSTIEAPRGVLSRPPLAIIRESVFNILGDSVVDVRVLDLFAGSGSLAIEALSRGAGRAHFVDTARRCTDMIHRNLRKLGISDMCSISRQDAVEFVKGWRGEPFALVFADPPFLSGKVGEVLAALPASQVLCDGATVVVRAHWRETVAVPDCLKVVKSRKFGESVVQFMRASRPEVRR
jgi:16S rRNA (guanine966-N2)-methyltransferase